MAADVASSRGLIILKTFSDEFNGSLGIYLEVND